MSCVILTILPWGAWVFVCVCGGGGGGVAKMKLRAADARACFSRERCFFKSIFSVADSSGHSTGGKYRVASETDAVL